MSVRLQAYKVERINGACRRLASTLRRCDPALPDSLRLMAVQIIRESLTRAYLGHAEIHPGVAKLARWGKCSERTAQRHVRQFEAWGLAVPVADVKGGHRATRYWIEPDVMIRVAMDLEANPHPDMMAEIRDLVRDARGDTRGDTRGAMWRDTCHPDLVYKGNVPKSAMSRHPSQNRDNSGGGS